MNLTGSKFVQGLVPRNSWAPPTGSADSLYSGQLLFYVPRCTHIHVVAKVPMLTMMPLFIFDVQVYSSAR